MTTKYPTTIPELSDGLVDITTGDHGVKDSDESSYTLVLVYGTPVKRDEARRLFLRGLVERLTDDELANAINLNPNHPWVVEAATAERTFRDRVKASTYRWRCTRCEAAIRPDGHGAWLDDFEDRECHSDSLGVHTPLTGAQQERISILCQRYHTDEVGPMTVNPPDAFSLPGWVECQIGNIYFGISPEGEAHS